MQIRPRSQHPAARVEDVTAVFVRGWERTPGFPMLLVNGDLTLSLESLLISYEVVDASPEERRVLQRWGNPFGGVQ